MPYSHTSSGSHASSLVSNTATPTPSPITLHAGAGQTNGLDDQFINPVTTGDKYDGDGQNGGHGKSLVAFDGHTMTCDPSMSNNYHVHAFVGMYVNGVEFAMSDGAGFAEPSGDLTYNGVPNQTEYFVPGSAGCVYHTHTHDPSGVVHVEDPNPNNVPRSGTIFSLGDFMNVWGQALSATQFSQWTGSVSVYTSGQHSRAWQNPINSGTYSLFTGDPNTIPLYSHEVIWIVLNGGPIAPSSLPNVRFAENY